MKRKGYNATGVTVSVPLSGIVSYTNIIMNLIEKLEKVSVPLSGIVSYTIPYSKGGTKQ